ncbi:MAG: pseudouridine synthase [Phyllobacteriaceae bacterium]|nr:pseudouridine synthase [Phyllobacteriaceae bacterium]
MASDDNNKGGRKGAGGPRKPGGGASGGRTGAGPRGGKSFRGPSSGGAKKPFRPRADRPAGEGADRPRRFDRPADGERKPFRPRADRPAGEGAERPRRFDKPADGERKPFRPRADRPAGEGADRPRRFDKPADGERKPFRPRADRPADTGADRPRRFDKPADGERKPFRPRADRPADAGADRPRRFDNLADGERKPFRPRADRPAGEGADRPRRFDRPADGERKPFRPRADHPAGDRPRKPRDTIIVEERALRPGRREHAEAEAEAAGEERIAKRLARAGVASRRDAELLIAAGRVRVNGRVLATPAVNVKPADRIEVDGKLIPEAGRTRLFLFHKPAGVVTTNRDPEGRKTVFDVLPKDLPRLVTIGRLDINTEGLMLLTNDGGLSRVLELPQTGWLRRYRVRVHGHVEETALATLKDGIAIDGVFYGAIEAELEREQGSNAWLLVGLREGKNREVKNVLGALGLSVTRLIRVSFGPFQLADLAEGEVREIRGRYLRDQLGPRLIEESGANFDAPEDNPEAAAETGAAASKDKPVRRPRPDATQMREMARDRMTTRPGGREGFDGMKRPRSDKPFGDRPRKPFGDKPFAKRDDAPESPKKRLDEPRRTANVWRAPGARPSGKDLPVKAKEPGAEKPAGASAPKDKGSPKGRGGPKGRGDAGRRR